MNGVDEELPEVVVKDDQPSPQADTAPVVEAPAIQEADPHQDFGNFLSATSQANSSDEFDGFLHDSAPQIARKNLDEFKAGKQDLSPKQVEINSKIAQDGVGAWESLGRAGKYIFGLLPDVTPQPGETPEQLAQRNQSTLKGVGSMIASGAKTVAQANDQLSDPEVQLGNDLAAGHPIDALWNYGLNKYKTAQTISQGAMKGITGLAPAVAGGLSEQAQLMAEPYFKIFGGKDAEQNFNASMNLPVYEAENLKNRAFDRINKESQTDPNSPLYQLAENVAPLLVPIGGEEAGAAKVSELADKIIDKGTRALGKTMTITSKAGPTAMAAVGAGLMAHGHPVYGGELMLPLLDQLGGKEIQRRAFGWGRIIIGAAEAPWKALDRAGTFLSEVPDGQTILSSMREGVEDEHARLGAQLADLQKKHGDKVEDAFKTTPDGQKMYSQAELDKTNKQAADVRRVQDKMDDLKKRADALQGYEKHWNLMSAAARTGIKLGIDTAVAGAAGAGFAASTESPGEYEQARQGMEAGMAIGLAARAPRIPLDIRGEVRNFNRNALIRSGQSNITPNDPMFEQHNQAMLGLPQEAKDYVHSFSGMAEANGKKVVVLSPEEFAKSLGGQAEDAHLAPNGYYENGTAYINSDALTRGPLPHEVSHALAEAAGWLEPNHPVNNALDAMIMNPKYHDAIRAAAEKYRKDAQISDPDYHLTPENAKAEIVADLASDIMQNEAPPEALYGGRSPVQRIGSMLRRFLGRNPPPTSVFHWPVTKELRDAVSESLFQAGQKAATKFGREAARSGGGIPQPQDGQARQDAIDQLNLGLKKKDIVKQNNAAKVDAAIAAAKQQGVEVNARNLAFHAQQGHFPRESTPAQPPSIHEFLKSQASKKGISGPALIDEKGALIGKGGIGQTHKDIMETAIKSGANADTVLDSFSNDKQHAFVTADGQVVDRAAAGRIADQHAQRPEQFKGSPLQSEHLAEKVNLAPEVTKTKSPAAAAPTKAGPPMSISDFLMSRLTKEEITDIHRRMDNGEIVSQEDLVNHIKDRMSGQRGNKLRALKMFQENKEPFKVIFERKTEGTGGEKTGDERVMNAQFGVTKTPEGEKLVKGTSPKLPSNPNIYRVYDTEAKGYRSFDIDKVKRIEDAKGKQLFMPKESDNPAESKLRDRIEMIDGLLEKARNKEMLNVSQFGQKMIRSVNRDTIKNLNASKRSVQDTIKSIRSGEPIAVASVDAYGLEKEMADLGYEKGEGESWRAMWTKPDRQMMPREEKKFSETIDSPAIRVSDMTFKGKSWGEAEKKAKEFGYSPQEIKAAEKGFVSNKGKWLNPDEASTFTGERKQMGDQQTESPLSVQAFNRWRTDKRKFQPSGERSTESDSELASRISHEKAERYFKIGQWSDEDMANNSNWIWDGSSRSIKAKQGGTHGSNFGHDVADKTFKGWFDKESGEISVVFPESEKRKLGNREPTVDDIPQSVYKALQNKFGKTSKMVAFMPSTDLPEGWQIKPLDEEQKQYSLTGSHFGAFNPEGELMFSGPTQEDVAKNIKESDAGARKFMPSVEAQTKTPEFKKWFGESKVVDEVGKPIVAFHGSQRPDRIGSRFRKSRATSGPMPFFTDDPEIASGYSTGKADTSLEAPSDYAGWFKIKPEGSRAEVPIDRAWYHLSPEQRSEITKKLYTTGYENPGEGEGPIVNNSTSIMADDGVTWELKQAHGNALKAATEIWLSSGHLFNSEGDFLDVLKALGVKGARLDDPHAVKSAVFPIYLSIKNPLDTSNIPDNVMDALKQASKRRRGQQYGADQWDKNTVSGREWIERLEGDKKEGTTHAWTSIPDWATDALKSLGYDGIKDRGGKYGGDKHNVWIPFDEGQVKSAIGNRGTFDPENKNISMMPKGKVSISTSNPDAKISYTPAVQPERKKKKKRYSISNEPVR